MIRRFFPLIFISFFLLLFFGQIIFADKTFFCGDTLTIFYPLKNQFFKSLSQGVFPLWIPTLHSGYPLFADISAGLYYLPNFFLFFSQSMRAVSLLIIFHFFLAGFAMYFLCRKLQISSLGAVLGSLVYAVSGIMVNYIAEPPRLATISLYPLFFLSLVYALGKRKLIPIILSGLVLAAQIFAGHIQYVYIELIAAPAFLFFREFKIPLKRKIVILSLIILSGVIFSSVATLPAFEFLPFTTRADISKDISVYQNFSLSPITLARFFAADFWGVRNQGSAWGTMDTSSIGYIGAIPILFFVLTFRKIIRNKNTRILLIGALIGLILSFGTHLPFFSFFVRVIPVFAIFRNPMAFLIIYTFCLSLLAGYSLDLLTATTWKNKIMFVFFVVLSALFLLVSAAVNFNHELPFSFLKTVAFLIHKNLSSFHTPEVDFLIAGFILRNFLIISILGTAGLFFNSKKLWIILVCADLFIFGGSNMFITDSKNFKTDYPSIAFLQKNLSPQYRYFSTSEAVPFSGLNDYCSSLTMQPPFSKEGKRLSTTELIGNMQHEIAMLSPDFGSFYNLPTIDGYTTFVMKSYNDIFQKSPMINNSYRQAAQFNPTVLQTRADATLGKVNFSNIDFNDELFDNLAVKYIVTDRELGLTHHKLVFSDGRISIYENLKVLPRAKIIDDAGKVLDTPKIIHENDNSIDLTTNAAGKLILADVSYPGWKVFVDGKEKPIDKYDDIFRNVAVEPNSKVRFEFQPRSFYLGFLVSFSSLSMAAIYMIYYFFRRKWSKS